MAPLVRPERHMAGNVSLVSVCRNPLEAVMGYRIDIDSKNCINCGICMDVCPVEALDMSRPQSPGVEAGPGEGPIPWLMERPIQVGECVGCSICIRECPVSVMTLATVAGPTALAPLPPDATFSKPTAELL